MAAPASVDLVNCEGNALTLVATLRARDTARSLGCRVMNAARQPPGLGLLLGLCIALVVTLVLATVCAQHSSSVRPFQSGQRRFFPVLTGAHRDGAALLRRSVAAASDAVPASQAQPGSEISRPTSNSTPPGAGNNQTGPAPVLELDLRQGIPNATMAKYHRQVLQYLGSTAFLSWRAELQHLPERRGILVAVGGAKLVSSLVVMLKVLRERLGCRLPVQVAYRGAQDLDPDTLASLAARFPPLQGLDLNALPQPPHHMQVTDMGGWVAKVYALMHCSFREVLLLDADSLPLFDPERLFESRGYQEAGSLMWPDLWANWVGPDAYQMLGLKPALTKAALAPGRGWVQRDTESGQVLLDRGRHADVLQLLWWINTFAPQVYAHVHGDKDTFPLAFALAGKAAEFRQVSIPPGGAFWWNRDVLEVKASGAGAAPNFTDGWQLVGMVQWEPEGRGPAFMHRTMNKFSSAEDPWPIQLITGPLPYRWARYYLAHDSQGPTKGRWWEHVVPTSAFTIVKEEEEPLSQMAWARRASSAETPGSAAASPSMMRQPDLQPASAGWAWQRHDTDVQVAPGCPLLAYLHYARLRALMLPVRPRADWELACKSVAAAVVAAMAAPGEELGSSRRGEDAGQASVRSRIAHALLRADPAPLLAPDLLELPQPAPDDWHNVNIPADATPIPALVVNLPRQQPAAQPLHPGLEVVQESYKAHAWLVQHATLFPALA